MTVRNIGGHSLKVGKTTFSADMIKKISKEDFKKKFSKRYPDNWEDLFKSLKDSVK